MSEQGLLTRNEGAALVDRNAGTLDYWAKKGVVKKVYIEGKPFYDRADLEAVKAGRPVRRASKKRKTRGAMVSIEENLLTIEKLLADNRRLLIVYKREAKDEVKAEVAVKLRGVLA